MELVDWSYPILLGRRWKTRSTQHQSNSDGSYTPYVGSISLRLGDVGQGGRWISYLFISINPIWCFFQGFLAPGELDPLNRRLVTEPKPEGFVQVCVLTDSELIQSKLAAAGIHIQQVKDLELVQVRSVKTLQTIYSHLGEKFHRASYRTIMFCADVLQEEMNVSVWRVDPRSKWVHFPLPNSILSAEEHSHLHRLYVSLWSSAGPRKGFSLLV